MIKNPFYNEKSKQIEIEFEPIGERMFVYPLPNPEKIGQIIVAEDADLMMGREIGIIVAMNKTYQHKGNGSQMESELELGDVVTYMRAEASHKISAKDVNGETSHVKLLSQYNVIARIKQK